MFKLLVIASLCSVFVAAEYGNVLLRPMLVPSRQHMAMMPHQRMYVHSDRIQRQVDFNANSAEARQKPNVGPRPVAPQQPQQRRPQFERPVPQQFQGQKPAGQPQRFNPHPPAQKPAPAAPLPDFGSDSEEKVERPLRQSPSPFRAPQEARPQSAEAPRNRNPEFANGFPSGFTNGLPSFDFQGRMPDADANSEGFMDGALRGFPSLKTFGGFDPLPDIRAEGEEPKAPLANRPGGPRPAQPGFQRPTAN